MKKLFLFTLLPLLLASTAVAQWTFLTSNTTRTLYDVFFIDREVGWVAGDSGLVLRTTDGGDTWLQSQVGTEKLVSIAFLDADTGYVLPEFSAPYYTHNGGLTWSPEPSLSSACLGHKLRFKNRLLYLSYEGCFGGASLYTLDPATHDTTETIVLGPNVLNISYNDIGFPGNNKALAMGSDDRLARTTDAGNSWTITGPGDTALDWQSVDFVSANVGYAVTDNVAQPIWKTNDGGQTWLPDTAWSGSFLGPIPNDLDYLSNGYGYFTSFIPFSTGGAIFELFPGTPSTYFGTPHITRAIHMPDDSVGYVVGNAGMIVKREGGPVAVATPAIPQDFSIGPNPATDFVTASWGDRLPCEISIYASDTRLLRRIPIARSGERIDLAGLPSGMLLLVARRGGDVFTRKLILERGE